MKIKLPKFPRIFKRRKKKLRLSTARRASASATEFDEMSEPNMKLSRALLIVLLLHVVAVGGIIAFNAIKSRQGSIDPPVIATRKAQASLSATPREIVAAGADRGRAAPALGHSPAARVEKRSTSESTKSYTVAKGDTPVTIAKKFKVPYDDLLAANRIEDPRKLKIGQRLTIPAKATAKTKKATD